jgi:hypothetical protein
VVLADSAELATALGRGSDGEGPRSLTDAIGGWRKGGDVAGERARRCPAAAAAGAAASANGRVQPGQ